MLHVVPTCPLSLGYMLNPFVVLATPKCHQSSTDSHWAFFVYLVLNPRGGRKARMPSIRGSDGAADLTSPTEFAANAFTQDSQRLCGIVASGGEERDRR